MVFLSGGACSTLNNTDMKKLLFAFTLLFGAAVAVNAQDTTSTTTQDQSEQYRSDDMSQNQDDDSQEISVAELPAAVQDKLQSQDYTGWAVEKAMTKEKDGQTVYAVKLKQGNETKKIKFDAMGNVLEEKDKDKNKEDKDQ
jgi:hypothetical protein